MLGGRKMKGVCFAVCSTFNIEKYYLLWFHKLLITPHGFDFITQKVEVCIGNFDKIFKILTFLLIFL